MALGALLNVVNLNDRFSQFKVVLVRQGKLVQCPDGGVFLRGIDAQQVHDGVHLFTTTAGQLVAELSAERDDDFFDLSRLGG